MFERRNEFPGQVKDLLAGKGNVMRHGSYQIEGENPHSDG